MAGIEDTWIWCGSGPDSVDATWARFLEDWIDSAINKDSDGYYSERIAVFPDGRLSADLRVDGSMSMLPMFFHQIKLRNDSEREIHARGPTLEEFYEILGKFDELMPDFAFEVKEDEDRRWVQYRVRPRGASG
jgi:hypothetical protein